MIYYVENMPTRILSVDLLDKIVTYAYDYLSIPENVVLEIDFSPELDDHLDGDVDLDETTAYLSINPNRTQDEMIATIMHEMVHIKQIIDGRLVIDHGTGNTLWENEKVKRVYADLPWEKEAFDIEKEMTQKFNNILFNS